MNGTAHRLLVQAPGFELSNATVTGSSEYNVVVQDTTAAANNAKFTNVAFNNSSKGGLLVLNSSATIENVKTLGNNWGGIQLAKKGTGNPIDKASTLNVVGVHVHDKTGATVDTTGVAVWIEDDINIVSSMTGATNQYTEAVISPTKKHYTK